MIEKRNEAIKDWEAIRALGICLDDGMGCGGCPMFGKYSMDTEECRFSMAMDVIDLINSQKAEIEELIYKLECLLCHATGGKLSKHTYDLKTMETAVTDACNEMYTDGYNEGQSEARAEIERLQKAIKVQDIMIEQQDYKIKSAKAEARKEFWEQIKEMYGLDENDIIVAVNIKEIDDLLAEMESDSK